MLNALQISKTLYFIDLSIEQSTKLWRSRKSAGRSCIWNLPEYCSSARPAHAYKILITTVCVQIDNVSLISDLIVVHQCALLTWFVTRFSQPSRNVSENRMTSFLWLLTPITNHKGYFSLTDFWHSDASLTWRSKTPTSFYPLKKARNSDNGNYCFEFFPLHAAHAKKSSSEK